MEEGAENHAENPAEGSSVYRASARRRGEREVSSLACTECRRRRVKCNGESPCQACVHKNLDCVFDTSQDARRKEARKRKADDAELDAKCLFRMLDVFRHSDPAERDGLVSAIRQDGSRSHILNYLDARRPQSEHQDRATSDSIAQIIPRHGNIMSIKDLIRTDAPIQVKVKPWTALCDDKRISHLISTYFTWWDPFWMVLDRDAFLDAMNSQQIDHPLCSPFLVHSMLALSSQYSAFPDAESSADSILTRGEEFNREALRLMDDKPSLTTLQGLFILMLDCSLRGRDVESWDIMNKMIKMTRDLEEVSKVTDAATDSLLSEQLKLSHQLAIWATFNVHVVLCVSYIKPVTMSVPTIGWPCEGEKWNAAELWSPYPNIDTHSIQRGPIFNQLCKLLHICAEIPKILHPEDKKLGTAETQESTANIKNRLADWKQNLPEPLQQRPVMVPALVEIHAMYFDALLSLNELLTNPVVTPPSSPGQIEYVKTRKTDTLGCIEEMLQLYEKYYTRFGNDVVPPILAHGAVIGCNILLRDLDTAKYRDWFSTLFTWIVALARRHRMGKATALLIAETANELGITLPTDVQQAVGRLKEGFWHSRDFQEIKSIYPSFVMARDAPDGSEIHMSSLLEKWSRLQLEQDD